MFKRAFLAILVFRFLFLLVSFASVHADTLIVNVPRANVREGPGTNYQVLTSVPAGTPFDILATQKGWYQIRLPDGRKGWISGSIVQVERGQRGIAVTPTARPLGNKDFYGNSWAVIIGIDRYSHPKIPSLRYAVNDAQSVAAALKDVGFPSHQTFTILNEKATKRAIEQILYDRLRTVGKEDRLLVFFAGHGETENLPRGGFEGFLLPYDAVPDNLFLTGISMTDVKRMGRRIAAKHILFVVDACYSGFTVTRAVAPRIVDKHYLQLITQDPAVQVITGGKAREQVREEHGHGVFTTHFLKGLEGFADEDQNGLITAIELASFLQSRVIRETDGAQHPQFGQLSGEGQFVFVLAKSGGAIVHHRREGELEVRSEPSRARVYVDGRNMGETPLVLSGLRTGRHRIRVVLQGYEPYDVWVEVAEGQRKTVLAYLEELKDKAILRVRTEPTGAEVYIDGHQAGMSPYEGKGLPPGRHRVKIIKEGYESWEREVTVETGTVVEVLARLEESLSLPAPGEIWVEPLTGMEFVWVPEGCFEMGQTEAGKPELLRDAKMALIGKTCKESPEELYNITFADEFPRHTVCVDGFWMAKCEVTNAQYRKFMPGHDSKTRKKWGGSVEYSLNMREQPVVYVSWQDAKAFTEWLTQQSGGHYAFRLPTEAEWEYACRAGTSTVRYWGNDSSRACRYENIKDLKYQRLAPYSIKAGTSSAALADWLRVRPIHGCDDGHGVTAPAGGFPPNPFGLHDMLGNVQEWCEDIYSKNAYRQHERRNPAYMGNGSDRVIRGGSFTCGPRRVRCACRFHDAPNTRLYWIGFRLVREDRKRVEKEKRHLEEEKVKNDKGPLPREIPKTFRNSIGMKMVYIPPGTFMMGSPPDEKGRDDDETQHQVTLTKGFYLQTTEVTQAQWKAVMGGNPSQFKGGGFAG